MGGTLAIRRLAVGPAGEYCPLVGVWKAGRGVVGVGHAVGCLRE